MLIKKNVASQCKWNCRKWKDFKRSSLWKGRHAGNVNVLLYIHFKSFFFLGGVYTWGQLSQNPVWIYCLTKSDFNHYTLFYGVIDFSVVNDLDPNSVIILGHLGSPMSVNWSPSALFKTECQGCLCSDGTKTRISLYSVSAVWLSSLPLHL